MLPLWEPSPDVVATPTTAEMVVMLGASRFEPSLLPAVAIAWLSCVLSTLLAAMDAASMSASLAVESNIMSTPERRVVSAAEEVPVHPSLNE